MVKNPPAMRPGFRPWVGQIPWREVMTTHSSILAWRIPRDGGAWWAAYSSRGRKSPTQLSKLNSGRVGVSRDCFSLAAVRELSDRQLGVI